MDIRTKVGIYNRKILRKTKENTLSIKKKNQDSRKNKENTLKTKKKSKKKQDLDHVIDQK